MSDQSGSGLRGGSERADIAAASRLIIASSRNVPIRIATATAISVAALPVMPLWLPALWFALVCVVGLIEVRLARAVQNGLKLAVWEGLPAPSVALSVTTGSLYGAFMIALWQTGDPVARVFAVAQTCISLLYVLLQYYAKPKLFLLSGSPYLAVVALGAGTMSAEEINRGHPWLVVTAVTALGLLTNMFRLARRQLAGSREALHTARAEAQERGVAAEAANSAKSAFLATMSH